MTAAPRVLVTGATGFVGSAVLRQLAASGAALSPRLLAHRRRPAETGDVVDGDLTDPPSLRGCCDGVDVLLHLAAEVGSSPPRCEAVNVRGTRAILAEAERAGVRHVVALSTAAVHGRGPHRMVAEDHVPKPVSPASQTRHAAENLVRAAGGVVLRPFLVYGDGDRWFVPALLRRLTRRPPLWVGSALSSVVSVDDLARVLIAAASSPADFAGGLPFHVVEPEPAPLRAVQAELVRLLDLPRPRLGLSAALTAAVPPVTARLRRLRRQLELVSVEHTYAAPRVWQAAGLRPGPPMIERLAAHAPWYRTFVHPAED